MISSVNTDNSYNFGVIDKKSSILDKLEVNTQIIKYVIPTYQLLYKEDSCYGIYECEDEDGNSLKLTGVFVKPLSVGQTYEVMGKIGQYKGEKQIISDEIKISKPINKKGIIAFLQTLHGLDIKAEEIYEIFGDASIDVLLSDPTKIVKEIKGIGKKSVLSWQEQLSKLKDNKEVLTVLLGYGLSVKQSRALFDEYKEGVLYKIEQNPYFISSVVDGYGFEKCDKIAEVMGYDPKGMFRIQEGIIHVLKKSNFEGHCYLPTEDIIMKVKDLLSIKIPILETKKLLIDKSGCIEFEYKVGVFVYMIKYSALLNASNAYYKETNYFNRDKKRYSVVDISEIEIIREIDNITQLNKVINEDDKIFLPSIYESENKVAERIIGLVSNPDEISFDSEKDLEDLLTSRNIILEDKQKEAVISFSKSSGGFFILNGSAGCGKTFTLNIILEVLEMQYAKSNSACKIKVFAPTGKASKVASRATGRDCMTIHRGLKYNPMIGFEYNEGSPLEADCIVVDESSMLDIVLAKYLLCAITNGTKVIFLGDTKQLPSVGAGNVLHDLIESGVVKVVTLDVVKRQRAESGIIKNANKIINKEMISSCKDTKDAYVLKKETPLDAQKYILKSINEITNGMGLMLEDIQILCPQKSSQIGTDTLNYNIQKYFNLNIEDDLRVINKRIKSLNIETGEEENVSLYFKKGDKVIHTKNNYNMKWYEIGQYWGYRECFENTTGITNGETGIIEDIIKAESYEDFKIRIIVKYEDKFVFYDDVFNELEHAYALTIHKSQGSQWKAVIIPIMKQNFNMLDNNLLYTGYTRAQSFIVVVGQEEAISYAIKSFKTRNRFTGLIEKIKSIK